MKNESENVGKIFAEKHTQHPKRSVNHRVFIMFKVRPMENIFEYFTYLMGNNSFSSESLTVSQPYDSTSFFLTSEDKPSPDFLLAQCQEKKACFWKMDPDQYCRQINEHKWKCNYIYFPLNLCYYVY